MAKVHITNVVVLENPGSFFNPFQFELTFECIEELKEDLEWNMIYVSSAKSEEHDQVLDTMYVGPVPDPPSVSKIPEPDAVDVTVVLLICSYRGQEFVRVGYFVNNDYADPEILASTLRVTRFKINWNYAHVNGKGVENGHDDDEPSTSEVVSVVVQPEDETAWPCPFSVEFRLQQFLSGFKSF